MTKSLTPVCMALAVLCVTASAARAQSEYVYRLSISAKFEPQSRVQTGFRLNGTKGIVTALHGVIDATDIRAQGEAGAVPVHGNLKIVRVDIARDMALLLPEDANRAAGLPSDGLNAAPDPNWSGLGALTVHGFPLGLPKSRPTPLSVLPPYLEVLRNLMETVEADRLQPRGSPDIGVRVVSINGYLLPGHSGAPILDQGNRLVAVGNGGLRGGTVGIGWAIPWGDVRWEEARGSMRLRELSGSPPSLFFSLSEGAPVKVDNPLVTVTESAPHVTAASANYTYRIKNTGGTAATNVTIELVVWEKDALEVNLGESAGVTFTRARIGDGLPLEKAFVDIRRLVPGDEVLLTLRSSKEQVARFPALTLPVVNAVIYDQGKGNYVPHKPKGRLLIGGGPPPGYKSGENTNRITIQVAQDDWGDADTEDIEAVLYSAANEFLTFFPATRLPPIYVKHDEDGPRVDFERGPSGEYVFHLSVRDRYWAQFAYQFSQMLGRLLLSPDRVIARNDPNGWFERSLGLAAALFTLKRMASTWETSPPYPNWRDYAPSLRVYEGILARRCLGLSSVQLGRLSSSVLPPGKTLAEWYAENQGALAGSRPEQCDKTFVAAAHLLTLFESSPADWQAVTYLNHDGAAARSTFNDYLVAWRSRAPGRFYPLIEAIRKMFGQQSQ